ncbi:MAG: hypothetical protein ASARMPREDX12_008464 [Alectoria sarmentosa]|nr:MAG: hypothetical protein ASARMPREDX12_008464 [Alectoria sarmentosa]
MASSLKPKATFNTLPREIRDRIYENMLTESKTIRTTQRGADYGQPEDMGTLRATLHACRASPQFAREAYETFFRINTFQMCEEYVGFLNMPVYYVKGQGFKPMMTFVKDIEVEIVISLGSNQYGLYNCFRNLLSCPVLVRVTVKFRISSSLFDGGDDVPAVASSITEGILTKLDDVLTAATGVYQELKGKIGEGLKAETKYQSMGEKIKAWKERMGKVAVEDI